MNVRQLDELKSDEGLRLKAYDDATGAEIVPGYQMKGHPSIAYGRALDTNGITVDEAEYLLTNSVDYYEALLGIQPWWKALDTVRQGVITNLAYNIGLAGVLSFRHMIAAIQARNWPQARAELLSSKWATEIQPSRRDRLAQQLETGSLT